MIFRGAYDNIDGIRRPYITVRVRSADGMWILLPFLIDSGADATFLDASCLRQIGANPDAVSERTATGVGGKVAHVQFPTSLRFESPEGTKTFKEKWTLETENEPNRDPCRRKRNENILAHRFHGPGRKTPLLSSIC